MSHSKYFDRIAWGVTAVILIITILFMNGAALGITAATSYMGYEDRLFDDTYVHTLEITMDNWDEFIANATSKEYYTADVVIDGEKYTNVGIRTKGNTSLSTVSQLGGERYSFKIEFDHYDSGKSYHGLDKLSLNNLIMDLTMMKDYLTYTLMNEFGIITTGDINSNPPDLPDGSDMGDIPDGIDMTNPPDGFDMTTPPDGFDMTTPPDGFGTVDSTDTSNSAPDAVIDSDEQDALVSSPESDSSSADTNTDGTVDSNTDIADPGTDSTSDSSNAQSTRPNQGGMNFPGAQNGNFSTQSEMSSSSSNSTIWVWLGISAVILGAGLIIAKLYRY